MALAKRLYFAALSVLIATRERLEKQVVVFVFLTLPLFYLNLTGLDNLILLTKNRQIKELISKQKIDFLPLSFLSYVKVKNYSLGEKKILSLLLLLLLAPRVVLLDEVLNGLDQKNRKVLLYCLVQLKKEATVILSGHEEYYLEMADELLNVKNGKIEPITSEDLRSFFISTKKEVKMLFEFYYQRRSKIFYLFLSVILLLSTLMFVSQIMLIQSHLRHFQYYVEEALARGETIQEILEQPFSISMNENTEIVDNPLKYHYVAYHSSFAALNVQNGVNQLLSSSFFVLFPFFRGYTG